MTEQRCEVLRDLAKVTFGPVTFDFGDGNIEEADKFRQQLLGEAIGSGSLVVTVNGTRLLTRREETRGESPSRLAPPPAPEPTEVWPPEMTDDRPWHVRSLRIDASTPVETRVREVPLWGKVQLINEDNDVWCVDCFSFVSIDELCGPDNGHRIGPVNGGPRFIRLPRDFQDDEKRARQPDLATVSF